MLQVLILALCTAAHAADFTQTLTAQSPLHDGQDAAGCQQTAEQQLEGPRAKLEGQCDQDGGQFNYGFVSPSFHRDSCTVYQTVTCSGTGVSAQPRARTDKPARAEDADLPPALRRALDKIPAKPAAHPRRKVKPKKKKKHHAKTQVETEKNG